MTSSVANPQPKTVTPEKPSYGEVVYHKLMTPQWLLNKATWNARKPDGAELVLEIEDDSRDYENILWVSLIPGEILDKNDAFTVKIQAILEHNNPAPLRNNNRNAPKDPMSIMVADGRYAYGIQIQDPTSYDNNANNDSGFGGQGAYLGMEGEVRGSVLQSPTPIPPTGLDATQAQIDDRNHVRWPQIFDITLAQVEPGPRRNLVGICSSALDGGYSTSFWFTDRLKGEEGLRLYLYRAEKEEIYNIKSLEVTIFRDCNYK
ncbi:MAG: hypothetical protein F6J93_33615 [Oscillatoria sp. SIO1A7]|nr:hypothetical protein [Oscillatoria sp. SIO1A7]